MPTHSPFQNLLKIKDADKVAPSETAFKDPLPPSQISQAFNMGGVDKNLNDPFSANRWPSMKFEAT